ncbi:MAG TPA: FAD-binding oxidoreductase [Terriglobales bacterium]|nr:FAD-binding oxidoreductase [Terriglobales bacterium]
MDDKHYLARITKRAEFADDLWMIRVAPAEEFKFAPGQYATLGADRDGKRVERAYSIVSSPYEKELEFFFELVPEGALTPLLYKLQTGDDVVMRKIPKGRFTLDTSHPEHTNHLLISTVTGIAPYVSYVRTLFKDWKEGRFAGDQKLFLLDGASRPWEFAYREELEAIAKQVPWFHCVFTASRPWEDPTWRGEVGRVDELIRKYADQWGCTGSNSVGYLCGHPDMIEHGKGILKRAGFKKENLKEEVYWIPSKTPEPAST